MPRTHAGNGVVEWRRSGVVGTHPTTQPLHYPTTSCTVLTENWFKSRIPPRRGCKGWSRLRMRIGCSRRPHVLLLTCKARWRQPDQFRWITIAHF